MPSSDDRDALALLLRGQPKLTDLLEVGEAVDDALV